MDETHGRRLVRREREEKALAEKIWSMHAMFFAGVLNKTLSRASPFIGSSPVRRRAADWARREKCVENPEENHGYIYSKEEEGRGERSVSSGRP